MKKIILLLIAIFSLNVFTHASFPVTENVTTPELTITQEDDLKSILTIPVVSGSFNWQAIVSVVCSSIAWNLSWYFCIPGLVFGFMAVRGDKNLKWLGWIGYIANAISLGIVLALLA